MKEDILQVMHAIVEGELSKGASSLQKATYNDQKTLISALFDPQKGYNTGVIMLRLVVIDSLYSTNAAYSYFSFEEMADKIYNLLGQTEEGAQQYFDSLAHGSEDTLKLFEEPFGIQKNLSEGSKQMSLLSKYAYYSLYKKEKYPLGFPIYDSLALEVYPTVCKMLGLAQETGIADNICKYIHALNQVREALFDGDNRYEGVQQFDILDAYLWRMGKFNGGNLSLLLGRDDYLKFVQNLGLNAKSIGEGKFKEETDAYKIRMIRKLNLSDQSSEKISFDLNKAVVDLYSKNECEPFQGLKEEKYLNTLLCHWRMFILVQKNQSARFNKPKSNEKEVIIPEENASTHLYNKTKITIVRK